MGLGVPSAHDSGALFLLLTCGSKHTLLAGAGEGGVVGIEKLTLGSGKFTKIAGSILAALDPRKAAESDNKEEEEALLVGGGVVGLVRRALNRLLFTAAVRIAAAAAEARTGCCNNLLPPFPPP